MKLYQRLNLPVERVGYQERIDWKTEARQKLPIEKVIENSGHFSTFYDEASHDAFVILEAYLAEQDQVAFEYVGRFEASCREYLFGSWRETIPSGDCRELPPNREWWDKRVSWASFWQEALLWFSAAGRWEDLLEFANFLRDDVGRCFEQSKENRAWLLLVAKVLRGDPREETQPLVETIFAGRRKREKLLYRLFDAILEGDEESANGALKDYSTYYRATEFPGDDLTKKVAFDASFLVHYAEYRDMEIQVPPKMVDHIVRFPPEVLKEAGC